MAVYPKVGGTWRTTKQPWSKVDGTWRSATKMYQRISGVWTEVWPLQPGPPASVTVASVYRNDRIEIDAAWTAPVTGAPVTLYRVRLTFTDTSTGVSSSTSWADVAPPTTALTFTNAGNGWQHRSVTNRVQAQVIPYSGPADDLRPGTTGLSASPVVIQLPAPPAPTSWNVVVDRCNYSSSWAYTATTRCTGFQIQTTLNGVNTLYSVASHLRAWGTYPWNASTIGRSTMTSQIRAVGPGGNSAWVAETGMIPGPITLGVARFTSGEFNISYSNNLDDCELWTQRLGIALVYKGTLTASSGTYTDGTSSGWGRDNSSQYSFYFRPVHTPSGWTGRDQRSNWCIKIPNPVYIVPYSSAAWRQPWSGAGYWRTDTDNHLWQGASNIGVNTGHIYYANRFASYFDGNRIGYTVSATAVAIAIRRGANQGQVAARPFHFWVMSQQTQASGPGTRGGAADTASFLRDQAAWAALPTVYYTYLISGSWPSLAIHDDNTTLRSYLGNVSDDYMFLLRPHMGTIDGQNYLTVRIHHSS